MWKTVNVITDIVIYLIDLAKVHLQSKMYEAIIWLMLSVRHSTKVITLGGFHCI
jgi:hypothetical protein